MEKKEADALQILRDALDTEPRERDNYVSMRCGDDTALRDRVDALLRGIADADLSEATLTDPALPDDQADTLIGTRLGAYRVVERIGRGGMGIVYRGARDGDDIAQIVAIKLIRRGFDFDDVHARFLRERRILARLSHPNLARFIDGGVAPDGRPWFALEFVRGVSITRWCDEHTLDVRERIRLFLDVCAAVQYAHTQLVVHRDLKPGNVLVDDSGAVRLLDFGVAGLLAGDSDDGAMPSTTGQPHAMTPEYAAPEQLAGEAVGVSADVYSLGVIAYELIAGVRPNTIDRRDPAAMQGAVHDSPPQSLAAAIARSDAGSWHALATSGGTTAPAIAGSPQPATRLSARKSSLRAYRSAVRGDLTRIIEKAIANEPARRYATVQAFADDLGRWRSGAPVHVSGNGLRYRLGKFTRRNRVPLAIAGFAAVAIVIGLAATLWQARKATQAAADAVAQATRATASRDFLASLLGKASPEEQGSETTTVREVLDRARERIAHELAAHPELRVEMSTVIARTYNDLAQYDDAIPLLREAVAIADHDASVSVPVRADAHSEYAAVLLSKDAAKEAEAQARIAITLLRRQPAGSALAGALDNLGAALYLQGRYPEGLAAQREGTDIVGATAGPDSEDYADELLELSYPLVASGRNDEAVVAAKHALGILDQHYPDGRHPSVSRALWAIGSALSMADRDAEAIPSLERAKRLVVAIYGKDSLKFMRAEQLLGVSELETGDLASATTHLADAERLLAVQAPTHPLRSLNEGYLGSSLLRGGDAVAAERVLRSGVEHALAGNRADLADGIRINLAKALSAQQKTAEALTLLDEVEPGLRAQSSKRLPAALIARSVALRSAGNWRACAAPLAEAAKLATTSGRTVRIDLQLERARVAAASGDVAARQLYAAQAIQLLTEGGARQAPEFIEATRLSEH